jgi:protein-tyrosine phosphatase/predicted kinase
MKHNFFKIAPKLIFLLAVVLSTPLCTKQASNVKKSQKTSAYYLAFPEIFQTHMQTLKNLDKKNPKVLILFSGTPGMGKTTISQGLEKAFNAIRLNSDEARSLLYEAGVEVNRVDEYLEYCLQELKSITYNKTIIIDRSSDRRYPDYARFASEQGYSTFMIRIVAPRELIEKRIRKRGKDVDAFLKNLDHAYEDYDRFIRKYTFDYPFDAAKPFQQELNTLVETIKKRFYVRSTIQAQANCMKRFTPGTLDYIKTRQEILACQLTPVQNLFIIPEKTLISEILPGLYLGSQKGCNMVADLERSKQQRKVSHIITCRNDPPRPDVSSFAWLGIDIDDVPDSKIMHFFDQTYNFIEDAKVGVLVHCKQGVSRSATITIAYLMRKFNVPYEAAFNFVFSKRPFIDPNVGFRKQLKEYEANLQSRPLVSK